MHKATDVAIRLSLMAGLALWCFLLFRPFLLPFVLGLVIAVALNSLFLRFASLLGGRRKLAATLFILIGVGALVVPAFLLSESFYEGVRWLSTQADADAIHVPPPPASVADWPFIGGQVDKLWTNASEDLTTTLRQFGPQVKGFASWLISTLTGLGLSLLITMAAIVVAGVMLMYAEGGGRMARTLGARLGGEQGEAAVDLAVQTIQSVATGVVGVAAVQAVLAAVGLFLADVPAAGFLTVLVLVLAVAQLPPLVILGPVIIYVIATSDSTLTQVLFTGWSLMVSISDTFLKPMFLGRGMKFPMPVILIGAIGGMIRAGIVGLFVGAVVLAVGYQVFTTWMKPKDA
jgi:predicted PurR-regulated permease PerM